MTTTKSSAAAAAAAEAARRAAIEAAKRAAEAAKRAAEARAKAAAQQAAAKKPQPDLAKKALNKPTASAVRQAFGQNEFSSGKARALAQKLGSPSAATSLRTEVLGDGNVNCLERAVNTAKPGDDVVLLTDKKDPVGHAVVERQDGTVVDPNRPHQPYSNMEAYLRENQRYGNPVHVSDTTATKLLRTPPGAARDRLIEQAGLTGVASRAVADPPQVTADYRRRASQAATDAQAAYDQTLADGGTELAAAQAASQELDAAIATSSDPEFARYVANASVDIAEDIAAAVGEHIESNVGGQEAELNGALFTLTRLADAGDQPVTDAIATSLANTLPDVPDSGFNQMSALTGVLRNDNGVELASALTTTLQEAGKSQAASAMAGPLTAALDTVHGVYTEAHEAREAADQRLSELLGAAGPLTQDQQQAFIADYRETHADVYAAESEAAEDLSEFLTTNGPALDAAVAAEAQFNPTNASYSQNELFEAYQSLAGSPLPARAVEWASSVAQDGSALNGVFSDRMESIAKDIIEPGLAGTLAQYQVEAGGDPASALERFETLFNQFTTARSLVNAPGNFLKSIGDAREYLEASRLAQAGDPSRLTALLTDQQKLSGLSGVGSSIAAASLAFAITNLPEQQGFELARAVASIGADGADLAVKAIGTLTNAGRISETGSLANGARFLQNTVLPRLGLALSALGTVDALGSFLREGGAENGVKLLTSAIGTAGAGLALFPPTAPIGAALAVIGTVAGIVADVVFNGQKLEQLREDVAQHLEAAGVDPAIIEAMSNTGANLNEVAEALKLSPEQMQEMLKEDGFIGYAPHIFIELANAYGIEGQQVVDLVKNMNEGREDQFFEVMKEFGEAPQAGTDYGPGMRRFLEENFPDAHAAAIEAGSGAVDGSGNTRSPEDQAVNDYNLLDTGDYEDNLRELLQGNSNTEYREALLRASFNDGRFSQEIAIVLAGEFDVDFDAVTGG
ncbi:MAG: hypothetical protein ACO1OB_19080 [Archangium sp.]